MLNAPLAHLSSADRALFYQYGIGSSRAVQIPIIHHSFEHHARTQPQAIAVEDAPYNNKITFAELDACSDRLAHVLRANTIQPGARVCILGRRSISLIAGVLAILKSGGQYIPLDALTITDDTLRFVLEDATPSLVLCMEEFRHRLSFAQVPIISLEPTISREEERNPMPTKVDDLSTPEDGVYCIYTSGTTGRPKGVDVRHRGVTNVISGSPGNVGMRPGLRVAQLLNIAFDMGAWEILGSLYNGCTLCLRGNKFNDWVSLLKTVDVVIATPSILTCHEPADYPNLKHVIVGGEPCPQSLADKWARYTNFNNCCGPTEISICNTVQPHTPGYPLSIGKPIPNTNVYILSRDPSNTRANAVGQVGCMWVGGVGVSNGYINMPDKTAERWKKDPFVEGDGMMFNTGDLGRWRKDGQLEHMGRADDQVKVKGFRIELDGVTMAMRTHELVKNAVALLVGSELWGFVTPSTVDLTAVRDATAKIQPYYAVPTRFLALDEFPITRNGKIDKRELHSLADAEKQRQGAAISPPIKLSSPSSISPSTNATSRITGTTGSTTLITNSQRDAGTYCRLPSITNVSITTTITSEAYAPDCSSFLLGATPEGLATAALFGIGDAAVGKMVSA